VLGARAELPPSARVAAPVAAESGAPWEGPAPPQPIHDEQHLRAERSTGSRTCPNAFEAGDVIESE